MSPIQYDARLIDSLNEDIKLFPQIHPITSDMEITYDGVSRTVMLDRYAYKDTQLLTLKVGDLVLVTYRDDPKYPARGYGHVTSIDANDVVVKLDPAFNAGATMTIPRNKVQKPLELFYEQIAHRVAKGLASVELPDYASDVEQQFFEKLATQDIVPAGRVLMGAGSRQNVTFFNCYVMPFIQDSRGGIAKHREKVMEIMSRGGGVGTNGSTLRPRDAFCKGVNGRSSGSVTWLHDLSCLTHLVEQGGSR